jgi:predicted esterase
VVAVGFSNGANIAASLLLLDPDTLAGAVLLRPMVPLVPDRPPSLDGKAVFIAAGRHDPLVAPAQSEELAALLRRYGAAVILRWYEGGHAISRAEIADARAWLASLPSSAQDPDA